MLIKLKTLGENTVWFETERCDHNTKAIYYNGAIFVYYGESGNSNGITCLFFKEVISSDLNGLSPLER